jgi:hypothetical protein
MSLARQLRWILQLALDMLGGRGLRTDGWGANLQSISNVYEDLRQACKASQVPLAVGPHYRYSHY